MAAREYRVALGSTRESRNTQPLELRFRALLTESNARMLFHRETFDRLGKPLA